MTGILLFVLLNLAPSVTVVPKYVKTATCNQAGPTGSSRLNQSVNPTTYYVDDPSAPGKFCTVDISIDVEHLPAGTYVLVPATTSATGFALVGKGNVEMFVKQ